MLRVNLNHQPNELWTALVLVGLDKVQNEGRTGSPAWWSAETESSVATVRKEVRCHGSETGE